jgi:HEAT repeat protein
MTRRNQRASPRYAALGLALALALCAPARADEKADAKHAVEGWIESLVDPASEVKQVQGAIDRLSHLPAAREEWVKARLRTLIENGGRPGTPRLYDLTEVYLKNFVMNEQDVQLVLLAHQMHPGRAYNARELIIQLGEARLKPEATKVLIDKIVSSPYFNNKHLYSLVIAHQSEKGFETLSENVLRRAQMTPDALSGTERLKLATIAIENGRGTNHYVIDELWLGLRSQESEITETAARYASKLKNPEPRFKRWLTDALGSQDISSRSLVSMAASWSINDDETIRKIAARLRTETDQYQISDILSHLKKEKHLPSEAQSEVIRYLDKNPRSSEALEILIHHRPGAPDTIEYAAKALCVPELGAQEIALSFIEKNLPLDAHIQNLLAQGLLNGHPETLPKVGALLKKQGFDGLESILLTELRKGKKARHVDLIVKLVETAGPWSEEFENSLKQLARSRKKKVALIAGHAHQATVKALPAGPSDAEELLLKQLTDPDLGNRTRAAQTLSSFTGDEHIAQVLVGRLAVERDSSLRAVIVSSLDNIGVHDASVQIALWDMIKTGDYWVSLPAKKLLEKIRPIDPVLYPIISNLISGDSTARDIVVLGILKAHLPLEPELEELLIQAAVAGNAKNGQTWARWLSSLKIKPAEIENQALRALSSSDPRIRAGAASFQFSEGAGGAEITARALMKEKVPTVRRVLVQTLLESKPNGYLSQSALLDLFVTGSKAPSNAAFQLLLDSKELDSTLFPKLEKLLKKGTQPQRIGAAKLVGRMRQLEPGELERLVDLMPKLDDSTRFVFRETLKEFGSRFVVPDALKLLKDKDAFTRLSAVSLLRGNRAAEADVQGIIYLALQKEKDPMVRKALWQAVQGKTWAKHMPESAAYLEEMLTSPLDRENRQVLLKVFRGWSEESPTLLPVLARFKGPMTHPDQQLAGEIHAQALAARPEFSDFALPAPARCVPSRLSKIWPFGKKTKH